MNYKLIKPDDALSDFIERFWVLENLSDNLETIVIPDGRVDVIFTFSIDEPFQAGLIGIETQPARQLLPAGTIMFGVSLSLLSVEYLLQRDISNLVNRVEILQDNFWDISKNDLTELEHFSKKISNSISKQLISNIDNRKKMLFKLIYSSNGSLSVKELSESVFWSARQINRYFRQKFGLSLKSYCNIFRFRAAFSQIKDGRFFPEENFADQAHFIREVKKYSGVTPKELFKNQNDRFIQFSTIS